MDKINQLEVRVRKSIIEVCERFKLSSEMLLAASHLIREDDIRIEMIRHLLPKLEEQLAWHDATTAFLKSNRYIHDEHVDALLKDIDDQSDKMMSLADDIIAILAPLELQA